MMCTDTNTKKNHNPNNHKTNKMNADETANAAISVESTDTILHGCAWAPHGCFEYKGIVRLQFRPLGKSRKEVGGHTQLQPYGHKIRAD